MDEIYCRKCQKLKLLDSDPMVNGKLLISGLCFSCNFWNSHVTLKDNENSVRVNGVQYFISENESNNPRLKGFGGDVFKILFDGGRTVETSNLWYIGEIPSLWKPSLPDNAEFIK